MTCQSSESTETIHRDQRSHGNARPVDSDEARIAGAMKDLRNTGWYWGGLTATEAKEVLQDCCEGTFLVRDSSQSGYLFTISAMTSAGPTNLRIEFQAGRFTLDSVVLVRPKLRRFDSVVHLVEHYVDLSRSSRTQTGSTGSTESSTGPTGSTESSTGPTGSTESSTGPTGSTESSTGPTESSTGPTASGAAPNGTVQLLLTRPAYLATPPLQHLCRVAINRRTRRVQDLPLPPRLKDYLEDYSYHV